MELIKISGTKKQKEQIVEEKDEIRVAAYIRVSTDFDDQRLSYESQKRYYINKINDIPKWKLIDIYGDEGISGTKAEKRPGFMKLIRDACNGKIDLILTKSISRFARNTTDTLKYVRLLKSKHIGIIFEEEKIDTLKVSGEFLLTVLGAIATQESYNLSAHTQLGLKMKMMRGENVGFYGCYGYKMIPKTKSLRIIPEQAEVVQAIFDMYIKGYSLAEIKRYLEGNNIKTFTNKSIWSTRTIRDMLQNEKYVGDITFGRYVNKNTLAKIKSDELYFIRNHHKAIIDRDTFEKANKLLALNHVHCNNKWHDKSDFCGTLKCGFCGSSVIRRNRGKNDNHRDYYCSNVLKNNWTYCRNCSILDASLIKSCFIKAMKKLYRKFKKDLITGLEDYEYNYVFRILSEYENSNSFNLDFYKKIIKYVVIGEEKENAIYPFNIRFIIKLEDEIFNYSQYIRKEDIFNQERHTMISFENENHFKYYQYDEIGVRHVTNAYNHTISVEYERDVWK